MNIDPDWLLSMVEKEGNGILSVGGLVSKLKLTEEEFLAVVKNLHLCVYREKPVKRSCKQFKRTLDFNIDDVLYCQWLSGGRTGGTCWGGEPNEPIDGEEEPVDFQDEIDAIIKEVNPSFNFLDYKELNRCIKWDYFTEQEYYGNYNDFTCKYIALKDIYNALSKIS